MIHMSASLSSPAPAVNPFSVAADALAASFDETLLYDPARYEVHKRAQLHRPPPAGAGPAIALATGEGWQPPEALARRRSHRRFAAAPLGSETFARALAAFRQLQNGDEIKALYPSTGGLYGIDVYLHVKSGRVDGVEGGVYFYHPLRHALHAVAPEAALDREIHHHQNRPIFTASAFTVMLVFNAGVTAPVYGASSQALAGVETGIMLATFNQVAETLGLGLCPVGLVDSARVAAALSLPSGHQLLHVAECGAKPTEPAPCSQCAAPAAIATAAPDEDLTVAGLRRFMASSLPEYMVPSQFIVVDEIPLTPNNKIDREALLKLKDNGTLELGTAFVATATELEAEVQAIWHQVIPSERIGTEDNFFDLGGDSMGVAEVRRHIAERWKIDIPILKLFQYPTIRATARFLISQLEGAPADATAPAACAAPADTGACRNTVPTALSEADAQALAWLRAHPDDPRAEAIAARLRQKGVSP